MGQQVAGMAPLYAGTGYKAKQAAFNQTDFANPARDASRPGMARTTDPFAGVGGMNRGDFRRFQKNNPLLWGQVTADKQYQQALFPSNPTLEYLRTLEQD